MRWRDDVVAAVQQRLKDAKFGSDDFTIGIQTWRGNIGGHGHSPQPLSLFVEYARAWLAKQPGYTASSKVGIYLMATKTPDIVQEVAAFPQYRWMFRDASVAQEDDSLPLAYEESMDLFADIAAMASTDFCSASDISNLGHLITELMVAWRGADAAARFCLVGNDRVCKTSNFDDR